MANSAIKPAGDWNLDEILADVRRMRGETSSPSGKNAPDRVEQILAELRAQPLGSAIRSNSTIQHTAAKHTAMSPLTTSRTSVAQDDIAPAQRPRQAAVSPPEDQSVNRRPSEKNEHISVPNQVVSSNSAKRGASVKTLSSTTAPDRSTLRNGGMNGIGNSKYIIMVAIAANTAVQVIFFAFVITVSPLRVLFSVC